MRTDPLRSKILPGVSYLWPAADEAMHCARDFSYLGDLAIDIGPLPFGRALEGAPGNLEKW